MKARRIAIFRALQLGDMLCLTPALRALRSAQPDAHITLVGLPWAREFAQRLSALVDDFVAFPGLPGFPEQTPDLAAMPGFIAAMRARRFDLLLQMHGSGERSNALLAAFGARRVVGFCPATATADAADPRCFLRWDAHQNEVLRLLAIVEHLGMPACGEQLEFPLAPADFEALRRAAPGLAQAGGYLCLHPGARFASRRWPAERFAQAASVLAADGLQVVITGAAQESSLTAAVCAQLPPAVRAKVLDLTGRTTLGSLGALLAGSRLLLCNDTGVSHLAAALAVPSVVVCSGADAHRWSPLDRQRHRVLWAETACRPCMHRDCPYAGHPCARAVSVQQVTRAAGTLLAGPSPAMAMKRAPPTRDKAGQGDGPSDAMNVHAQGARRMR